MSRVFVVTVFSLVLALEGFGQSAVTVSRPEVKQKEQHAVAKEQEKKAQRTGVVEFQGQRAFDDKTLRSVLKEQIATINDFGLTAARGDDAAFFLELYYRKNGYSKVSVRYRIVSSDRLLLEINEGPLMTLGLVTFDGNVHEPTEKLFEYAVGPTRERYSKLQKKLPFVASDVEEGAELVQRLYVAEGFLDAAVADPTYRINDEICQVDVVIPIKEGRQYTFGNVAFTGNTVYDAETLRGQIGDLLSQPYTEVRVADIPRRLQSYFKTRGYYAVKVEATGDPGSASNGRVPVKVAISAGQIHHFGDVSVSGLQRLHPSYVEKRFAKLSGQIYSPEVIDDRFRTLMRSGLFNVLQIRPVPVDGDTLRLEVSAEEAKSKQLGLSIGYGTFEGFIGGVEYRERNMFGSGRPFTASLQVSQRSYKGELLWEDPYFFDSEFQFKARLAALTFDYDGYSKFELGGRLEFLRKITKQYQASMFLSVRHVEVTSAEIKPHFLGPAVYFINTIGFSHTFDLRESPLVSPRGFVADNTWDVASSAFGSQIDLLRTTLRMSYYLPFGPRTLTPGVVEDGGPPTAWQRWWQGSSLAFGARLGVIHSLSNSGSGEFAEIPIDERFFNGGASSVRSFIERDLGPHDRQGNPIGGEFSTVFNVEYTFPIFGELQGALFTDAGNLLLTSEEPGLDDMRYAVGVGLRYKLPIGPIRLDYGINPNPGPFEDAGAFHFSFGFAF